MGWRIVIGAWIGMAVCWPVGRFLAEAIWVSFYYRYRPLPWPERSAVEVTITLGFVASGMVVGGLVAAIMSRSTLTAPIQPWWKRKTWRAAAALWLALPLIYAGAFCPAAYCVGRGWIGYSDFEDAYRPAFVLFWRPGGWLETAFYYWQNAGSRATQRQTEPYSPRQEYYRGIALRYGHQTPSQTQ